MGNEKDLNERSLQIDTGGAHETGLHLKGGGLQRESDHLGEDPGNETVGEVHMKDIDHTQEKGIVVVTGADQGTGEVMIDTHEGTGADRDLGTDTVTDPGPVIEDGADSVFAIFHTLSVFFLNLNNIHIRY